MGDTIEPREAPSPAVRASDGEREAALSALREALAEGRITTDEFGDRAQRVVAARTRGDLDGLLADLPSADRAPARPARLVPHSDELVLETTSGSRKQRGWWVVPPRIVARCTSGSIRIDFTEAECPHSDVTVEAESQSGSVVLIVPHGWGVLIEDVRTRSGRVSNKVKSPLATGGTVLHVYGEVASGSIKIRHPRRRWWQRDGGQPG